MRNTALPSHNNDTKLTTINILTLLIDTTTYVSEQQHGYKKIFKYNFLYAKFGLKK